MFFEIQGSQESNLRFGYEIVNWKAFCKCGKIDFQVKTPAKMLLSSILISEVPVNKLENFILNYKQF